MLNLSNETRSSLLQAVDMAADLNEAGHHPTDAVKQAALALNLAPQAGALVAKAYNVGRAAVQREGSDDTHEKLADFVLADPEAVEQLLQSSTKTAADSRVSDDYSLPGDALRRHYVTEKVAQLLEVEPLRPKAAPLPQCRDKHARQIVGTRNRLHKKLAAARGMVDQLSRQLDASCDRLLDDLSVVGTTPLDAFAKAAEIRGDNDITALCRELGRRSPMLCKRAARPDHVLSEADLRIYRKMAEVARFAGDVRQAGQQYDQVEQLIGEQLVTTMRQVKVAAEHELFADVHADMPGMGKRALNLPFSLTPAMLGGMGASAVRGAPSQHQQTVQAYLGALDDPEHENRLHGIRARSVIEQMMAMDPVLSGYHPDDVMDAYNNVTNSAPHISEQPLLLQSMLRRYLGQGNTLDPDDIQNNLMKPELELVKARQKDVTLPETHQPPPNVPGGGMGRTLARAEGAFSDYVKPQVAALQATAVGQPKKTTDGQPKKTPAGAE